jgi:TrmH family RNA methyltransferase
VKLPQYIQSKDNPRIKQIRGLLEQANIRRKSQQTVLEGVHLLDAYQRRGLTPHYLCLTEAALKHPEVTSLLGEWPMLDVLVIAESLYQELRTLGQGIDVMGVIDQITPDLPTQFDQDVLILENVQDAGNVGTLLRTAAAAGIQQVICTTGTASIWSPRVLRAGMGAQFSLYIYEHVALDQVWSSLPTARYATSSHATTSLYQLDLRQPHVWVMGNEGQGQVPPLCNMPSPFLSLNPVGKSHSMLRLQERFVCLKLYVNAAIDCGDVAKKA